MHIYSGELLDQLTNLQIFKLSEEHITMYTGARVRVVREFLSHILSSKTFLVSPKAGNSSVDVIMLLTNVNTLPSSCYHRMV